MRRNLGVDLHYSGVMRTRIKSGSLKTPGHSPLVGDSCRDYYREWESRMDMLIHSGWHLIRVVRGRVVSSPALNVRNS